MNILSVLFSKINGDNPTEEQMNKIRIYVDSILESSLASDEESRRGLDIYRYTDQTFSVVKTILYYPNGSKEVGRSIILRDNTQVYDGNNAIKTDMWFEHLESVYYAAINSPNPMTYKKIK